MRTMTLGVVLLSVAVLVMSASGALAAGRVALVVGNSAYAAIGALPNPGNEAADVAASLGRLGFDVTTVRDADRVAMSEALRVFTRESAGADVALVFYAGHGLEMDGVNYLVPVDAQLERDTDVRFEAINLDDVLASTVGASLRVMGRYEVTLGEYRAFASATGEGAGGCFGDSRRDPGFPQTDRHPVTCVSGDDAQTYVSWLSRLAGGCDVSVADGGGVGAGGGGVPARLRTRELGTGTPRTVTLEIARTPCGHA